MKIINQAFVTVSVEARLPYEKSGKVGLEFSAEPLTGTREEQRILRVTLTEPGLLDVTIAFGLQKEKPDLGGRDRIHLLLQCTP